MVILIVLVGVGMYLVPSPFQPRLPIPPQGTSHTHVVVRGIPDTNYTSIPPIAGRDSTSVVPAYTASLRPITIKAIPDYVEQTVYPFEGDTISLIRATAFPFVEEDTLKINQWIEWNLQPKPIKQITRIDTVTKIDSVFYQEDRPWITEPYVVATGTTAFWVVVILTLF